MAEGLEGALAWLAEAENDPRRAAVVEGTEGAGEQGARSREQGTGSGGQEAGSEGQGAEGREAGQARIVQWTPNRIQVEAEGPGLLVLSEVYDPDWRGQVDGREVEIVRADGILRGITLEEGQHQVTFVYRPAGLGIGCGVTAAGWACAAALWALGRKHTPGPG
jgi:hypothetical protein